MTSDMWNRAMHDADSGRLQQAITNARVQQRLKPKDAESAALLGLLLQRAGDAEQSLHHLRRAVALQPEAPLHRHHLAMALLAFGHVPEAVRCWRETLARAPGLELAWMGLMNAYLVSDDAASAAEAGARGMSLTPDWADMVANHATALSRCGRVEEAIEALQRFLQRHPDASELRSNMLLLLNYTPRDPHDVLATHQAFGKHTPLANSLAQFLDTGAKPHPDPSAVEAPARGPAPGAMRIGILSSDLRNHSVGFFAEAFIRHAPRGFELVAFSTAPNRQTDPCMLRLKGLVQRWHDVASLDSDALDALIRRERLDVLLEMNGHTAGGRLQAIMRRPAPVIVSLIGYPNTTGVPSVGWRVVDSITDPPGAESFCTERLLRLDPCFLCYTPPEAAPEPRMPATDGPITFGSFNNALKIAAPTTEHWASVLHAVSGSRLLLKSTGLSDPAMQAHVRTMLARHGVTADRLEMAGFAGDRESHLALYNRVHVALDTMPYNGTTTTCEALWMGVPVVTTLGDRHASRVSASLLHAAGFPQWVAADAHDFTRIAAHLANDRAALATLRTGMRDRLRASTLLDAPAYAQRLHAALASLHAAKA